MVCLLIHSGPLVRSMDIRSFSHVRSIFGLSQSEILILASNLDIRSAHFYGQFSLDKRWTLQAGSSKRHKPWNMKAGNSKS